MSLSSLHLDAFTEVARIGSFSKAAEALHVTQSALSQRIQNLEEELEATLFVRDRAGIRLTETGEMLLRYCQARVAMESEVLSHIKSNKKGELTGLLRIAAYSSVLRSVLIPTLAPFLQKHDKVQCQFESYEMNELENILVRGEADFVVLDFPLEREGVIAKEIGEEEYVLIESKEHKSRGDIYLDHDAKDFATLRFFRDQGKKIAPWKRSYMGDVYGILDGVKHGIGRAVMSKHLVTPQSGVKIVPGFKSRKVKVYLHYFEQPFYPELHKQVLKELTAKPLL